MTTITITLADEKVQKLTSAAESYGLNLEQFVAASIEDLASQQEPDFRNAVGRVLEKNKELYKRLA